jgi:site-specific DNA-methyltransferase (adenine-specific)/modification methylase
MADVELAWTNLDRPAKRFRGMVGRVEFGHPTQKPLALMDWTIEAVAHCHLVDCVLDPFMGSGTTGVACIQSGRAFTGIERERKYFDIACERIERAHAQGQLFAPVVAKPEQQEVAA